MSTVPQHGQCFGQPRGLTILFLTEMWEIFFYYGMRALLVYYMTKQLLLGQQQASLIYGIYTATVYFTPIIGGAISDRRLGRRRAVIIGGSIMAIGQFLMASEALFYFALAAIALGNGLFLPSLPSQIDGLYAQQDPRRGSAYNVYYVGINLGGLLAPLVCGTLGEVYGWHWGFAAAGVGMLLGLTSLLTSHFSMALLGYGLAVLIGISLGLLGGGGAILTIPMLIYFMDLSVKQAVPTSLVIVGLTSFSGMLRHWQAGTLNVRAAVTFGPAAILGSLVGTRAALLVSPRFQLTIFALVLLSAAAMMLRPRREPMHACWPAVIATDRSDWHRGRLPDRLCRRRRRIPVRPGADDPGRARDEAGGGYLPRPDHPQLGRGHRRVPGPGRRFGSAFSFLSSRKGATHNPWVFSS